MSPSESFAMAVFFITFFPFVGFLFYIGNRVNTPRKTSAERLIDRFVDQERPWTTYKVTYDKTVYREADPVPVDPAPLVTPPPVDRKNMN